MTMKTVFITGATSGIGMEFARIFAKKGYRLILTGRRKERFSEIKNKVGTECLTFSADLSDEDECRRLLEKIRNERIDIFINNAGFGTAGSFLDTDIEKEIKMIKVNDVAMHYLFKNILKKMVEQGSGTIVNVASSAGLLPAGPYMATYYASKAYVASLTKAVSRELKENRSSVYVCCLCPGPVDTEFSSNADVTFSLKGITARKCVKECIRGMRKHQTVIIPTIGMRCAIFFGHFLPEKILIGIIGSQQKKKIKNA